VASENLRPIPKPGQATRGASIPVTRFVAPRYFKVVTQQGKAFHQLDQKHALKATQVPPQFA
jgi:hypothetical protein